MSGIAGVFSPNGKDIVLEILQKIKHRGTSKPKFWQSSYASLGAVALMSIREKPGPIKSPSGERAIVMDGCLTNNGNLKELLELHSADKGLDAEVILHASEEKSSSIFEQMEGEFALAIADGDRLILARDRLGIRPLYYGFFDEKLCFASEIKALVDWVDEVREFPPGHFMLSDSGMFPYQPYFPEAVQLDSPLESADQLTEHLNAAINRSIPDDVEVGIWLSGGVDSSAVAALARPMVKRLHTFSIGTENAPDIECARQVANHIDSKHHERIFGLEDIKEALSKVIFQLESFDSLLVRSTIVNYLVAELSADYVPFVLSGEGGDELFAGYSYQKACSSEVELTLSVQESIAALHNTALQRVDRSAASHSTGVSMPFLDPEVVRYALAIPSRWKIRGPQSVEKWPLRKMLDEELPDEVIWRDKVKFWKGAGTENLLSGLAKEEISKDEFKAERNLSIDFRIRSKEELLYYRIFKRFFGDKVPFNELGRTQHI